MNTTSHVPTASLPHLASGIIAIFALALPPVVIGQPLSPATCPAGSVFDIRPPGLLPFPPGAPGIPLLRHTLDPVLYPDAVCNDGSRGVIYVRPADAAYGGNPIVDPSSKWLVFLDGGGGCRDAESCIEDRWCGGDAFFERAGKMSSRGAWPAIRSPGGIFELAPTPPMVNHLADYNQVFVLYCSSDNWVGSAGHMGLATSTGIGYDIRFEGEAIVEAVFDTLLDGPTAPDPAGAETFYDTALPDLHDATEILIAGESAGGGGVRHHLDRLREEVLEPVIPGVEVRGIIDAGAAPGLWDSVADWSDPSSPLDYVDFLLTESEPALRGFWGADDSALDQSCLDPVWAAAHALDGGSHPQVCYDTTYTLLNHITTPVFLRMDIDDPMAKRPYVDWALFPTSDDYWTALFDQLTLFSGYAAGVGGLEPPLDAPGVQGPNCGEHVAIARNDGFFRWSVIGPAVPTPLSFHDLLRNWLLGLPDTVQIQEDNPLVGGYSASFCP